MLEEQRNNLSTLALLICLWFAIAAVSSPTRVMVLFEVSAANSFCIKLYPLYFDITELNSTSYGHMKMIEWVFSAEDKGINQYDGLWFGYLVLER